MDVCGLLSFLRLTGSAESSSLIQQECSLQIKIQSGKSSKSMCILDY